MYDYHNDWLGGFNLYSLQYGDKIKVGKDTEGIILGVSDWKRRVCVVVAAAMEC